MIGIAEIVPNVSVGRHTYPGPEFGYMLEGEMVLMAFKQERTRNGKEHDLSLVR